MYSKIPLRIDGVKLKHTYSIDTNGVVVNETDNKILKGTSINRLNRYVDIHFEKFYKLHRLVAEHFLLNPLDYDEVNHIDGNRNNNTAANLEWCSHSENMLHAYRTGLKSNKGMNSPTRILHEEQVKQIWGMRKMKLTARQIRDRLKLPVSVDCVKSIRSGKTWVHLTSTLP